MSLSALRAPPLPLMKEFTLPIAQADIGTFLLPLLK
jgi:hypothetical protein